mmetsp:Transcript_28650/g.51205  ORF Transcript_28650/g.51205 Transcript_28650/m.51205 type:complete len:257 (-) Transcript_28650:428-1198(-)
MTSPSPPVLDHGAISAPTITTFITFSPANGSSFVAPTPAGSSTSASTSAVLAGGGAPGNCKLLGGDPTGAALAVFAFGSVDFGALGAAGVVLGGAPRRLGGAPTGGSGLASLRGGVEGAAFFWAGASTNAVEVGGMVGAFCGGEEAGRTAVGGCLTVAGGGGDGCLTGEGRGAVLTAVVAGATAFFAVTAVAEVAEEEGAEMEGGEGDELLKGAGCTLLSSMQMLPSAASFLSLCTSCAASFFRSATSSRSSCCNL